MKHNRLEQLHKFLEEDPNDPFLLYALATEYNKLDHIKALSFYEKLLKKHEDYVGTYYHAAKLYNELGKKDKAEATFKKGILMAQKMNDFHALRELQTAYNNFLFEEDAAEDEEEV